MSAPLDDIMAKLAGQRIAGGCDDCEAYQEVEQVEGIWVIHVSHDDGCPALRRITPLRGITS